MTSEQNGKSEPTTIHCYCGGRWTEREGAFNRDDDENKEYDLAQTVGSYTAMRYELWERQETADKACSRWVIVFFTGISEQAIEIETFPDLIELMNKLSTAVLAAIPPD
jgi:hypothetical protein